MSDVALSCIEPRLDPTLGYGLLVGLLEGRLRLLYGNGTWIEWRLQLIILLDRY